MFDGESKFGRLMSRLFNLFRFCRSNMPICEIYTNLFFPALSNYSRKAKSLAALMHSESETYAATSNAPDVITIIFKLSVEIMESVASILDPIVETMRQSETIDLATVSCSNRTDSNTYSC